MGDRDVLLIAVFMIFGGVMWILGWLVGVEVGWPAWL